MQRPAGSSRRPGDKDAEYLRGSEWADGVEWNWVKAQRPVEANGVQGGGWAPQRRPMELSELE